MQFIIKHDLFSKKYGSLNLHVVAKQHLLKTSCKHGTFLMLGWLYAAQFTVITFMNLVIKAVVEIFGN